MKEGRKPDDTGNPSGQQVKKMKIALLEDESAVNPYLATQRGLRSITRRAPDLKIYCALSCTAQYC